MKVNLKRYALYLIRWQLSTPILAVCVVWFVSLGATLATVIANFIGGLIFFWVDRFIFQSEKLAASWQVKEQIGCVDCGTVARGYRLVKSRAYDKINDEHPEFRCEICSAVKSEELKNRGVRF
jgi:hypothetical protein